jgi:cell division inhibitor SepF
VVAPGMVQSFFRASSKAMENTKHDIAQRVVDFLGGVAYALDGDIQCVSNKIFIIAPKNVDISGHFKEELKANGLLFSFAQTFK